MSNDSSNKLSKKKKMISYDTPEGVSSFAESKKKKMISYDMPEGVSPFVEGKKKKMISYDMPESENAFIESKNKQTSSCVTNNYLNEEVQNYIEYNKNSMINYNNCTNERKVDLADTKNQIEKVNIHSYESKI
uniref:hypothetical protein n=1 Tax=Terrisporobacter petrolearius TaxID=1460447 RepID=UPI0022E92D94